EAHRRALPASPGPARPLNAGRSLSSALARFALPVRDARQRSGHGLLEALGAPPLLRRPALAVLADLIHRRVQLDVEAVRVLELDARIAAGSAPAFVGDRHALRPEKIANLEQLGDGGYVEGGGVEAGLPFALVRVW